MYKVALVLQCLAYVGHGGRVRASLDGLPNRFVVGGRAYSSHTTHRSRIQTGIAMPSTSHLLSLRGGEDTTTAQTMTLRLRTQDGVKRVTLPSSATLLDLKKLLQKVHKFPIARQRISNADDETSYLSDSKEGTELSRLGIAHGAILDFKLAPAAGSGGSAGDLESSKAPSRKGDPASASPARSTAPAERRAGRTRAPRKRRETLTELIDKQAANEVVLQMPGSTPCQFVSVDPSASKAFADFVLDNEFKEYRIALMFGRWTDFSDGDAASNGKRGVMVDVFYEPPQMCSADAMAIDNSTEADAEIARALDVANATGLQLVGFAYAHPPRHNHSIKATELAEIARQLEAAAKRDPKASELFIGLRFRAVLDGEPIEGYVTADAYQPTKQARELVDKGVLTNCPSGEEGQVGLTTASGLQFRLGPSLEASADVSYFVSRVHDLAFPYKPPAFGAFRHRFPVANRGLPPVRKLHLRTFLEKQRKEGVPFAASIVDFQLLLHVSKLLPSDKFQRLCEALTAAGTKRSRTWRKNYKAAIDDAERWLQNYAGRH